MIAQMTEANPERERGLAEVYEPRLPGLDELLEPDGSLRQHWGPFVSMMDDLGHDQVISRRDHARQLIRENGITHNVYGESDGLARPWNLDLLPLLFPQREWAGIGESLIQRARLLDALLADLYGPATCISSGILPPELIYGNPWFLRAVHGVSIPQNRWIHLYAADLVRRDDGRFCVLTDRTQSPSGTGYSLENRIVISRVLPTVFRQCNVLRLAPFFIGMRKMLTALAPRHRENPRIVLLTPGPYNETYFEHAYLARYLGYTLVQGNDLTVRDCRVFLKTLGGLQPVDVILRRVDDDYCDPLELYGSSCLGVPGLVQAVREGSVAVANAIGAGVLQSPAFFPFLPALCRHFLSQDLAIGSVPTWWCGQNNALKYVIDNLRKLVIKPAFPRQGTHPIFAETLSATELSDLTRKILAKPAEFVAQENLPASSAPVLLSDQLQSRRCVIRAFLSASDDSYITMPGALTRIGGSPDAQVVSLQSGGGSKDTWILGSGPVSEVSLLTPASQPVALSRGGGDLTSRVADDLFWLGRYTQRAESVVRLARSIFKGLLEPNSVDGQRITHLLLRQLVQANGKVDSHDPREVASRIFSPEDPTGLRNCINHMHSLARVLRDRISADAWQILREIERDVSNFTGILDEDQIVDVLELLNKLVAGFLAFAGMVADSMTRGQAWRFLDMGMRIERGIRLAELIRKMLAETIEEESLLLDSLLDIADSSLTYRRRYFTRLEAPAVIDLLVADESNPRSVGFQAAVLEEHLAALPRDSTHPQRSPDRQRVMKLRAMIKLTDLTKACRPRDGRRFRLESMLSEVVESLAAVSEMVSQIFFSHATPASHLVNGKQDFSP
jgi:uncharacterized circularly permuted ATP-grasp superfamily protein/uncharacterized alpha-E superfamily protein